MHKIDNNVKSGFVVEGLLTHWGRVTHICVGKLTIIGSDNGLSPGRRQAIIRTNAGISLIGPLGTNFSEILVEILTFSFKKMRLKMSSGKRRPFCLGLNELTHCSLVILIPDGGIDSDFGLSPFQYQDNTWWFIFKWTLRNKLQWNHNHKFKLLHWRKCISKCHLQMLPILFRPQLSYCVYRIGLFTAPFRIKSDKIVLVGSSVNVLKKKRPICTLWARMQWTWEKKMPTDVTTAQLSAIYMPPMMAISCSTSAVMKKLNTEYFDKV